MAGDPTKVRVGPGYLYIAPVGVDEPDDLTTDWDEVDETWVALGYTEEGHRFSYEPNFEAIEVAEELEPIRYEQTRREMLVAFSMAEITARNYQVALNGGTIETADGVVTFEPPEISDEPVRTAIGWESFDHKERFVYRKCLQVGNVETARRKAPDKALIPVEFRLEKPDGGEPPFLQLYAADNGNGGEGGEG